MTRSFPTAAALIAAAILSLQIYATLPGEFVGAASPDVDTWLQSFERRSVLVSDPDDLPPDWCPRPIDGALAEQGAVREGCGIAPRACFSFVAGAGFAGWFGDGS